MAMSGPYPRIDCPECDRRVKVSPSSERILRHDSCPAVGRRVDLYGTEFGAPTTGEETRHGPS